MNNTDEVFKNYLRDYQKPIFNEILRHDKVLLKAPMDFGKTYLACDYVSYLFETEQIRSAIFSIPNYQMRNKIVDDLHRVGLKDKLIVCLEGKKRAYIPVRRGKKRTNIGTILKEIQSMKDQIIDVDFIRNKWPRSNPYKVLMALQEGADIIIVHHSMLKTNKKVRKTDLLVVDDADLMNRDSVFSVAKYMVFKDHLQAMQDSTTDANEIREKLKSYITNNKEKNKMLPTRLDLLMDVLFSCLPENPEELERKNIAERQLMAEMNPNPLFAMIRAKELEGKSDDEKLRDIIARRLNEIKIGISQASNPVKLQSSLNLIRDLIKADVVEEFLDNVDREVSYSMTAHIDQRIEDFFDALVDPEFSVKEISLDVNWKRLEVYMTNGSDFMDVVNQYHRVLWISATIDPESPEFKEFKLVRSTIDPHAEHKHVAEISGEKIPDLLSKLKGHNVYVITNSTAGAEKVKEKYGGEIITGATYDVIIPDARRTKGNLVIGYLNGIGSRGLDDLANLFDVVIVNNWIYRSVMQEEGKYYGEEHMKNNRNDTLQLINRIMRGSKDHLLFVVKDENEKNEAGSKFYEFIKAENPGWNIYDDVNHSELVSKIPERIPKEPTKDEKLRLRKETRTLKDGSKELVYRQKATDEEIEHAPDFIEL